MTDGDVERMPRPRRVAAVVIAATILAGLGAGLQVLPARAAASVNLDQWASLDLAWQNGNLNGNNSKYPEGGIVPFRLALEGLTVGAHSIHINYDFTAGGHKAYDFLATWNVTNANGRICAPSGGAISSMCPSIGPTASAAFPSDPFVADGLSVAGAQLYSAASRRLTIWGGTISSISGPVHSGSVAGNSSADFVVHFKATNSAVLLAWGGHLAQSSYWNTSNGGPRDGAAEVSGAPWHMRTLQLDGTGNKNQDRSIQPSAIVGELPPFALATPTPAPKPTPPPAPKPTPAPAPTGTGGGPVPAPTLGPPIAPGLIPAETPRLHLTPPPTSTAGSQGPASDRDSVIVLVLILAGLGTIVLSWTRAARPRFREGARRH